MIIAFTGHRDCNTPEVELDGIAMLYKEATWVHGGAVGFDTQVENYARKHGIHTTVIRPDYDYWIKKGRVKYAPLARDKEIVEMSEILFACYDGRDKGGTKFMVEYARSLGKGVIILPSVSIEIPQGR